MSERSEPLVRLQDYLDSGRFPFDPRIEYDPVATAQLATLVRLRDLSGELAAVEAAEVPASDPSWFNGVMARVRREARAGRDIPLASRQAAVLLHMTEGAVRGLIREAGDTVDGAVVLSCLLDGEVEVAGAPVRAEVTISARRGAFVPTLADEVREAVAARLLLHTELVLSAVDVVIGDVHVFDGELDDPSDLSDSSDLSRSDDEDAR